VATGAELSEVQLLCDIRPIFNEEHSEVLGAIPITTLKLDVVSVDGSISRLEIRLTEEQVYDFCDKVLNVNNKINTIKSILKEKSITLPKTPATMD
jgi:hypothetical protein